MPRWQTEDVDEEMGEEYKELRDELSEGRPELQEALRQARVNSNRLIDQLHQRDAARGERR